MEFVAALTTAESVIGWALVAVGVLAVVFAVVVSGIEAVRKLGGVQATAAGEGTAGGINVGKIITEILKELMGKTGGPTFFFGLVLVAAGVFVLNDKI